MRGLLTDLDVHSFAAWCSLAARLENGEMGSAWLVQFRSLSGAFGMTPAGRLGLGGAACADSPKHGPGDAYFTD